MENEGYGLLERALIELEGSPDEIMLACENLQQRLNSSGLANYTYISLNGTKITLYSTSKSLRRVKGILRDFSKKNEVVKDYALNRRIQPTKAELENMALNYIRCCDTKPSQAPAGPAAAMPSSGSLGVDDLKLLFDFGRIGFNGAQLKKDYADAKEAVECHEKFGKYLKITPQAWETIERYDSIEGRIEQIDAACEALKEKNSGLEISYLVKSKQSPQPVVEIVPSGLADQEARESPLQYLVRKHISGVMEKLGLPRQGYLCKLEEGDDARELSHRVADMLQSSQDRFLFPDIGLDVKVFSLSESAENKYPPAKMQNRATIEDYMESYRSIAQMARDRGVKMSDDPRDFRKKIYKPEYLVIMPAILASIGQERVKKSEITKRVKDVLPDMTRNAANNIHHYLNLLENQGVVRHYKTDETYTILSKHLLPKTSAADISGPSE